MSDIRTRRLLECIAFVATVLVAVALVLQLILNLFEVQASVIGAISTVGECIAYLVLCFVAYGYIKYRKSTTWTIIYAISVTVILVLKVLMISMPALRFW